VGRVAGGPGCGDVTGRKLVEHCGGPLAIRSATRDQLTAIGCSPDLVTLSATAGPWTPARVEVERITAIGARLVALDDPEYPPLLRELHDAHSIWSPKAFGCSKGRGRDRWGATRHGVRARVAASSGKGSRMPG